jgi:hypothetical protein
MKSLILVLFLLFMVANLQATETYAVGSLIKIEQTITTDPPLPPTVKPSAKDPVYLKIVGNDPSKWFYQVKLLARGPKGELQEQEGSTIYKTSRKYLDGSGQLLDAAKLVTTGLAQLTGGPTNGPCPPSSAEPKLGVTLEKQSTAYFLVNNDMIKVAHRRDWNPSSWDAKKNMPKDFERKELAPMLKNKDDVVGTIIIHHTASGRGNAKDSIVESHKKREFSDIGYHFIVPKEADKVTTDSGQALDAEVLMGRDLKWMGSHASGLNNLSIGIVLMGNFANFHLQQNPDISAPQKVTAYQEEKILKLIKALKKVYPQIKACRPHRYLNQCPSGVSCPGVNAEYLVDKCLWIVKK